ncbi:MAG: hypothetical protein V4550_08685 [Gemmatimonadota bacterium]
MTRNLIRSAALVAALGLTACERSLEVTNPNSGDSKKVLATATDAENLVGGYFKRWSTGLYGSLTVIEGMTGVMSMMNFSSLANNCLNARLPFAGANNDNTPGNVCTGEQFRIYTIENEVQRVASTFLAQVEAGLDLQSTARKSRDQAFAEFLRGMAIGHIAMFYDSTAIVTTKTDPQDAGTLVSYKEAGDSAMAAFQRAIDYASAPVTGSEGFPIPITWIPTPTALSQAEFIKVVRSYRARVRANIARTPAERAAVNWASVIADAQGGITADMQITTGSVTGIGNSWRAQYDGAGLWHQMPPFVIGMADVSGSYATWQATAIGARGSGNNGFFMVTPDLRFPQGATRAAQQADFSITSCAASGTVCKRYFVNRPGGNDQFAGAGWGWSNYDIARFHPWRVAGDAGSAQTGNTIYFAKAELDMLQAEGLIRTGNAAGAATLINVTRVKNGLPAITDPTAVVPGGADCVPKVPIGPAFTAVGCGSLLEAMKYEKRLETAFIAVGPWYLDGRGWGDLAAGTPLFWATPVEDLLARSKPTSAIYGTGGGVGMAPNSVAPKGTYGW